MSELERCMVAFRERFTKINIGAANFSYNDGKTWEVSHTSTVEQFGTAFNCLDLVKKYHTSQTCSACGHYEEGQRVDQATFVCKGCGAKMNADFNAALNIARSDKVVTKKEQCEAYKRMRENGEQSAGA